MDITPVNAVQWVRSRPQQFFASNCADAIYLLAYVMADVIQLGGGSCTICPNINGWWIIGSDINWLRHKSYSVSELFSNVVAEASHGEHSMRGEILLAAFAKDVLVVVEGNQFAIQGDQPPADVLEKAAEYCCAIAFHM